MMIHQSFWRATLTRTRGGSIRLEDAVGGLGGWYYGRYGADSGSTTSPWSVFGFVVPLGE